jgi:proton glutamate symport protein
VTLPRPGLTTQILLAMAAAVLFGWLAPGAARASKPLGDLFIRLVLMIVAPLVFSTLVVGIARCGDFRKVGRLGLKTLAFFLLATTLSILLGIVVALALRPGAGGNLSAAGTSAPKEFLRGADTQLPFVLRLVPTSIVDAMARGDILQIVLFSLLFGMALLAVGERGRPVQALLEGVAEVMFRFTHYVMYFAPLGVFGAVAAIVGTLGIGVVWSFAAFVGGVVGAQAVLLLVVFALLARLAGVRFWAFLRAIRAPFLIAFSTTSSGAALPKALEAMEQFGVKREVTAFVLPAGLTFNLDGAHLYLAFSAVFLGQAYGVEMGWWKLLLLLLLLNVTAKGIPTIPRGSLLVLASTIAPLGIPLEGIAVLLAIDQIPDMARTAMNLTGNCLACTVVDKWESGPASS